MKVEEFRRHKFLPNQWKKEMQTNGILQLVLEVLEEAHPARFPVTTDLQDDLSPTKAALQLGETRGYSKALNTIKALQFPLISPAPMPEPTYQPAPKPEEESWQTQ